MNTAWPSYAGSIRTQYCGILHLFLPPFLYTRGRLLQISADVTNLKLLNNAISDIHIYVSSTKYVAECTTQHWYKYDFRSFTDLELR